MTTFKPLLAFTVEDTSKLPYPNIVASYKYDGIRVIVIDGVVYSRSMKPIRSKAVQQLFGVPEMNGLDGEIIYGEPNDKLAFNVTTSAVMSTDLPDGFDASLLKFYAFDDVGIDATFFKRYVALTERVAQLNRHNVITVKQHTIENEEALLALETAALDFGMEGLMVRTDTHYKQGRSTAKECIIGKIKRFADNEAVVIGFEEKLTNTNVATKNELGYTERSTSKEGLIGADTLGALICECNGIRFTMGSGFDDAGRSLVWRNKDKYLGKLAKFKHFPIGQKDSFRFPIFQGWRDVDDL